MKFPAIVLALLLALGIPPALSQTARTDAELEQLARDIAIDAVKFGYLRWPPKLFPLRVAFAFGENIGRTECAGQWQQKYDQYVQFINAKEDLLVPTPISKVVDAFVFFGSEAELKMLPTYLLQGAWRSKSGISIQFQNLDRYDYSYTEAFGEGNFIEFSANFQERNEIPLRCDAFDSTLKLGSILMPAYAAIINAQAARLLGHNASPALEWRAHRRLLAAMVRLPDEDIRSELVRRLMIKELSND